MPFPEPLPVCHVLQPHDQLGSSPLGSNQCVSVCFCSREPKPGHSALDVISQVPSEKTMYTTYTALPLFTKPDLRKVSGWWGMICHCKSMLPVSPCLQVLEHGFQEDLFHNFPKKFGSWAVEMQFLVFLEDGRDAYFFHQDHGPTRPTVNFTSKSKSEKRQSTSTFSKYFTLRLVMLFWKKTMLTIHLQRVEGHEEEYVLRSKTAIGSVTGVTVTNKWRRLDFSIFWLGINQSNNFFY